MATQIIIKYEGETYKSAPSKEGTVKEIKDAIYEHLEEFNKLELELEDGGFLLIPNKAINSCVILVKEV